MGWAASAVANQGEGMEEDYTWLASIIVSLTMVSPIIAYWL